jgi:hypothetical protein
VTFGVRGHEKAKAKARLRDEIKRMEQRGESQGEKDATRQKSVTITNPQTGERGSTVKTFDVTWIFPGFKSLTRVRFWHLVPILSM